MTPTAPLRHPGGSGKRLREGLGLGRGCLSYGTHFSETIGAQYVFMFFGGVGQPRRLSLGLCIAPAVHRSGTGVFGMLLTLVRRSCTCVLFRFVQLGACLCSLWSCLWAFFSDPVVCVALCCLPVSNVCDRAKDSRFRWSYEMEFSS